MHKLFDQEFRHQQAIVTTMNAAEPAQAKSMSDVVAEARAAGKPWDKIFQAIMTAAAGGFSPAAIAAAIAILFGQAPPAALHKLAHPAEKVKEGK